MSFDPSSVLIGFAAGTGITCAVTVYLLRRHLRAVRQAERRARAAERLAEVGAMTGGLAHEIKNPLSTIGLNAQLLAEGVHELELDAEVKGRLTRRVDSLRREVERLGGILQDFLDFAGEMRLDRTPINVNSVVDELADFFLPQCEQNGIRLRVALADGPLTADIDARLIKQAVLNLMINGVQAMERAAEGQPRELLLRTDSRRENGQDMVRIHVVDTGPGISDAAVTRVFQPYFTTKSGGSGLGLPTSRRIVESHGGRIDLATESGRGSEFTIVLPAVSDHASIATRRR